MFEAVTLLRAGVLALAALMVAEPAWAQLGAEIARRHAERAGRKLADLETLYAEGRTFIGAEVVPFKTWAARPDRLKVESAAGSRRVVQCFDGVHEPWLSHSELRGGAPQRMTPADARDFIGNADFEGPLVHPARKGLSVDYAGEEEVDGRRAYKLLVMNARDDITFLWVDAASFEIVKRSVYRVISGQRTAVETSFKDFRPVGGVLQPHRIETRAGDRTLYVMVIDRMEANSRRWPKDVFAPPEGWPELRKPADVIAEELERQSGRN